MGMYTEFHFNAEIKQGTPQNIINILEYLVGLSDLKPIDLPEHNFFSCERWDRVANSDSFNFSAKCSSALIFEKIGPTTYLNIKSNLKNYDDEIQNFVDWIDPYVYEYETFLGFYRYEESEEPTLIYKNQGGANMHGAN
jgi:hypothetical protein